MAAQHTSCSKPRCRCTQHARLLWKDLSLWRVCIASSRRKQRQRIAESRSAPLRGAVLVNTAGCVGQPVKSQDKPVEGITC